MIRAAHSCKCENNNLRPGYLRSAVVVFTGMQVAKQTADVPSAQAGDESGPVGCVHPPGKLSQGLDPELEGELDGIEATPNIVSRTVGGLYRVIGLTHYRKGDP